MTPVTRDDPPPNNEAKTTGKELMLLATAQKPEVLSNRSKLPLHLLNEVGRYFSRNKLESLRMVCKSWNRFIATRPSHFHQRYKLYSFSCDVVQFSKLGTRWTDLERFKKCCGHLEELASEMVGERFFPDLGANMKITMGLERHGKQIYYCFHNKFISKTAFHVVHLFSHLCDFTFNWIHSDQIYLFPRMVHPDIVALFCPIHCQRLMLDFDLSMTNIPSLEAIAASIKPQKIEWELDWNKQGAKQVPRLLEMFAINGRRFYKCLNVLIYAEMNIDHQWTALFDMAIKFFSNHAKDLHSMVPSIRFTFDDDAPRWPLDPFSDLEPIIEQEVNKRTYELQAGGKTFKVVLKLFKMTMKHNWRIRRVSFHFD